MDFTELRLSLKSRIYRKLAPRINKTCVLFDLPYHTNIGDTLIWQGEEIFLSEHNIKCLTRTSHFSFKYKKIFSDTTVLLHGGGNFGDIWRHHQEFRLEIIKLYPDNPIVIFPQTLYYDDESIMRADAELMNRHKKLTICARDRVSFDLLNKYFTGSTNLLVPDMAYCISDELLEKYRVESDPNLALYLRRTDNEYNESMTVDKLLKSEFRTIESQDWPFMSYNPMMKNYNRIKRINTLCFGLFGRVLDFYMYIFFRPAQVKLGTEFVSRYSVIYTTRLHVAILASLLGKPFTFINNSYGKNKQFYDAWMSECDEIKFYE